MSQITLRFRQGVSSPEDLQVEVKENTYEYLMISEAATIRVSAYLDRDWPRVEAKYEELFLSDTCPFESRIQKVIPGSRTRKGIQLPGPMQNGEQLILEVVRGPAA